jgi:hypothetical protein
MPHTTTIFVVRAHFGAHSAPCPGSQPPSFLATLRSLYKEFIN